MSDLELLLAFQQDGQNISEVKAILCKYGFDRDLQKSNWELSDLVQHCIFDLEVNLED